MSPGSDDNTGFGDSRTADSDIRWSQVVQQHYEPDGTDELTTTIIFAIAEAEGVSPSEIQSPPLYTCIDAPALEDTFFGPDVTDKARHGTGTVAFRYTDYLVKVRSDGWVQVFEPTQTDSPD